MKTIALLSLLATHTAFAHDGHAASAAHWHATDVWLLMAGLAAAGALMWWRSRK